MREFAHATHQHGPREASTVSSDDAFIGDNGGVTSQEQADTEEGSVKFLIVRNNVCKVMFGHIVPRTGIDEKGFAVDAIVQDAKWLGYTKIMLKTDKEPAILKLLTESLRELRILGLDGLRELARV